MAKFEKLPVVIDAVQLTWANWSEICDFVPKPWFVRGTYLDAEGKVTTDCSLNRLGLIMQTLESQTFVAQENDWIIKGVNGEYYPCKPDIFEKTYRAAATTKEIHKLQLNEGDVLFVNPETVDLEALQCTKRVKVPIFCVYPLPGMSVADSLAVVSNPETPRS